MTLTISKYTPTLYILYLDLLIPERFNELIIHICENYSFLTRNEIIQIVRVLYYDDKWSIEKNPSYLSVLSSQPFASLPEWVVKNETSTKYRTEKTFNGIPFNLAKSGVQKYIRRAKQDKAVYLALDMYLTQWTEGAKGMLTNLYNRIRIIFLEDISIAAPSMIQRVNVILDNARTNILSAELPYLIHCMSKSLHTRCYSHIKSYYRIEKNKPSEKDKIPENRFNLEKDEKIRVVVDCFIWCLEQKNIEAFWWLTKILENEKLSTKRDNSTRPGFLIFNILTKFGFITDSYTLPICKEWYKIMKMKEQNFCLIHPVMLYILDTKAVRIDVNDESFDESYYRSRTPYNSCLLNNKIRLDNFVYDKHTQIGRDRFKRNYADFALEGSLVAFDLEVVPNFSKIYMEEYLMKGTVFSEKAEFKFKIRTQLNTSAHKPDVYFAKNILNQNVVVKGPYTNLNNALLPFKLSNIAQLFPYVNVPNINIRILYSNMWDTVSLGIRNSINATIPQFFVIMDDIMNLDEYPMTTKNSKVWKNEPVVDWDKLFSENTLLGIGIPSTMSETACFSLLIQLAFRLALQIGDNSYRNFIRVGDIVYNIDLEGFMGGTKIQWSAIEIERLNVILKKYNQQYRDILQSWLGPGDSYINRWDICRLSFFHGYTEKIRVNITEKIRVNIQQLITIENINLFNP